MRFGSSTRLFLRKAGVLVGNRGHLNFLDTSNITWTLTDDSSDDEIEVSASATGLATTPVDAADVTYGVGDVEEALGVVSQLKPQPYAFHPRVVPFVQSSAGGRYPSWLSNDGTRVWANLRSTLRWSDDEGATWNDGFDFDTVHSGAVVLSVRETQDGELLAFTGAAGGAVIGRVYRSTGYGGGTTPAVATWTEVLEMSAAGVFPAYDYGSVFIYEDIVVVGEYGPKAGAGSARYAYISEDGGLTFRTIFDLLAAEYGGVVAGRHVHGVCYDHIWDRVWITFGDDISGTVYSDDWQNATPTWTAADYTTDANGRWQSVSIIPLERCLLLMSDGHPNGVHRIPRFDSAGDSTQNDPQLEVAYTLDNEATLTWLGHQPFKAQHVSPAPLFLPFGSTFGPSRPARLLMTVDGYSFEEVWRDTRSYSSTSLSGLISAIGPTQQNGKLLGVLDDNRIVGTYSKLDATMPLLSRREVGTRGTHGLNDSDPLHPGLIGAVPGRRLLMAQHPLLINKAVTAQTTGQFRGVHVACHRRGRITVPHIYVGTQSGNIDVGIYRVAATRQLLWSTGSIACPAPGWQSLGTETGIEVEAGDVLCFGLVPSDTTATFAGIGPATAGFASLPPALNDVFATGASLKMMEAYAATPGSLPATVAEGSVSSPFTTAPIIAALIVP